jgi:putative flippase GtrA
MNQAEIVPPATLLRTPLDAPIVMIASRFGDKAKDVERFLRFAVVGVFGAAVDFGTVTFLQATFLPPSAKDGEKLFGNVFLATSIAFVAAVISNFTWNRLWTYPDSQASSPRRQLVMFTFISLIGYLGRTFWITTAYHWIGEMAMPLFVPLIRLFRPAYIPTYLASDKLGTMIAMLIGVVVVMFWNYFANRRWTYSDVK